MLPAARRGPRVRRVARADAARRTANDGRTGVIVVIIARDLFVYTGLRTYLQVRGSVSLVGLFGFFFLVIIVTRATYAYLQYRIVYGNGYRVSFFHSRKHDHTRSMGKCRTTKNSAKHIKYHITILNILNRRLLYC